MARRLSENGKVIVFCLLFPLLWPFLPVVLICMAIEGIRDSWRGRKYRKRRASDSPTPPPC